MNRYDLSVLGKDAASRRDRTPRSSVALEPTALAGVFGKIELAEKALAGSALTKAIQITGPDLSLLPDSLAPVIPESIARPAFAALSDAFRAAAPPTALAGVFGKIELAEKALAGSALTKAIEVLSADPKEIRRRGFELTDADKNALYQASLFIIIGALVMAAMELAPEVTVRFALWLGITGTLTALIANLANLNK